MNNTTLAVVYNLNTAVSQASVYVYPLTITLTALTNLINLLVLSRPSLLSSSCTHYLLALAIDSLIYICFTPMNLFLVNCFGISISNSPFGCRILYFFVYSTALYFTMMLVCASIDRFLTSSSSPTLRNLSNVRTAKRVIVCVTSSLVLYMSPFIIISYWDYKSNQCLQYSSTLITVYLYSRIVIYNIIGPFCMALFGLLTINNIQNQRHRVAAFVSPNSRRLRTERQLTRLLILQIGMHLLFSLPNAITYVITTFVPSVVTSSVLGFRSLSLIWQQGTQFLSLFFYVLSASAFRKELMKLFKLNHQYNRRRRRFNLIQRHFSAANPNNTTA